jgi:NAD(P)-dependent dehydrogenase (short-subunit alcohol dehydrogenase family)
MALLEGRTAIVTGAGRGLGRAYALMLARHGANVVVNDLGSSAAGDGIDATPAEEVVSEIEKLGGKAVINTADVSNWKAAQDMVAQAVDTFGSLEILVNNAGIIRDRMLVNMSEDEWDSVTRVHLKGTFAPLHHAANYWRLRSKGGETFDASVINTTSHSALFANVGQTNYAAAKAGIATMTVVAARELARFGVRLNAIAPRAQTRMTEGLRQLTDEQVRRRQPEWIATLVAYLASVDAKAINGRVFEAWGFGYSVIESWQHGPRMDAALDPTEIGEELNKIVRFARPNAGIDRDSWLDP